MSMNPLEVADFKNTLDQFYGTETWHRFSMSKLLLTDGVKYLCEKAGCYWLMDIIASYQKKCMKDPMLRDFQIWELNVNIQERKGVVSCLRDTNDVAFKQTIPYTDFPLDTIKLYCENRVICLPSER